METIFKHLQAQAEALQTVNKGGRLQFNIDGLQALKTPATMTTANFTGSGVNAVTADGMGYIPIRQTFASRILDMLPKVPVSSRTLVIANETSIDGAVTQVNEGAAKPLIDNDFAASNPDMRKFAANIRISKEMIEDIGFVSDAIERRLSQALKNKISADFLTAIMAVTPTLVPAGLTAGTGSTGKLKDLLPAIYQDMLLGQGYAPDLFLFNRPNYAKAFNEQSVNLLWYGLNNPVILPCSQVATANVACMDTNMFPLYVYKDISIEIGKQGTDFTENTVTLVAEARVAWNLTGECLKALYNASISSTVAAIA
jgi:hypothetical protein